MLWEVDVLPAEGRADRAAERFAASAAEVDERGVTAATARGFLLEGRSLDRSAIERIAAELLTDSVVEMHRLGRVTDPVLAAAPARVGAGATLVQVLYKTGVMDPTAQSVERAVEDLGLPPCRVQTLRKYWVAGVPADRLSELCGKLVANDAIERVVLGPLSIDRLDRGRPYEFVLRTTPILGLDAEGLARLSREGQLYLQPAEMLAIQRYFAELGREPTDVELETIAQTWSEHCSHKTLAGRIAYRDERGERRFENMLKETIFAATNTLRQRWGADDWCVSVFKDNAGIVLFDEQDNVTFKVETHNHPSALEPYGGANTGLGGVLRDTLGTGLGAKPVASTDVFCFAPPATPDASLPAGVLAPRRVMRGVVEGVRDYGNRMGIPTVNGAICFDERYLGNPLVFCGSVGVVPRDKSFKETQPGDLIVALGGRTGRDGIHGATFSSAELTSESESLSGGAVQIGNAIEEKKVLDALLAARDRGLFTAVTDCGAGGFSSAVGEMGEAIGAEVDLDLAPLKYDGLSYTEVWISEAQERMVLSVPESSWDELRALCAAEGVEATVLGRFVPTGNLTLRFRGQVVGELPMAFLHGGRPPVVREAVYEPPATLPFAGPARADYTADLLAILAAPNVASKEWVVRQYDHEVQGGSVVKPLVGPRGDGPGNAAVVRPKLSSRRGIAIGCGLNPRYGDFDTYRMAASAIDEAIRNVVAVGADPARVALLDNFCWGDCERASTLGALVRAALACHDLVLELDTPFISGKDSLNNEFRYDGPDGERRSIAIPPTLLISALGQLDDVAHATTMDLKCAGNSLYVVGLTRNELGGSHYALVTGASGGEAPTVDPALARAVFAGVHRAIRGGVIAACHDASEGGLAAALAEMAFTGELGAEIDLSEAPATDLGNSDAATLALLFSESNTRFVCEVPAGSEARFERFLGDAPHARVGIVSAEPKLSITTFGQTRVAADLATLKTAWQTPLLKLDRIPG
ncbi:MAG: phosphoribosylformylglycinamidine synthase subunit PurL [Lacipirellulaceae bacterium]